MKIDFTIGHLTFLNFISIRTDTSFFRYRVQIGSTSQPASYPMGTWGSSLGVKWPSREADHSPPSSAEAKSTCRYTSILRYFLIMALCVIKQLMHI